MMKLWFLLLSPEAVGSPAIFPPHWNIHIEFPARIQNKKKTKRTTIEDPARTPNKKKTRRTNTKTLKTNTGMEEISTCTLFECPQGWRHGQWSSVQSPFKGALLQKLFGRFFPPNVFWQKKIAKGDTPNLATFFTQQAGIFGPKTLFLALCNLSLAFSSPILAIKFSRQVAEFLPRARIFPWQENPPNSFWRAPY